MMWALINCIWAGSALKLGKEWVSALKVEKVEESVLEAHYVLKSASNVEKVWEIIK